MAGCRLIKSLRLARALSLRLYRSKKGRSSLSATRLQIGSFISAGCAMDIVRVTSNGSCAKRFAGELRTRAPNASGADVTFSCQLQCDKPYDFQPVLVNQLNGVLFDGDLL